MKPARYIFINKGLGMSGGKIGAQAAHAETLAAHEYHSLIPRPASILEGPDIDWRDKQERLFAKWFGEGHYAKYVMEAEDDVQMLVFERYLNERGYRTYLVIDEGHTEGTYFKPTAMAVELIDKDNERDASVFGLFKLYKDPKPPEPVGKDVGPPPKPKRRFFFWKETDG
jgi:peptidyl-tRNA hydrolase